MHICDLHLRLPFSFAVTSSLHCANMHINNSSNPTLRRTMFIIEQGNYGD